MSRRREALLGEFRVSLPRTLAPRRPSRITASRGSRSASGTTSGSGRATILKGAVIPDDTAVAAAVVVAGQCTETGTVLAGRPARMVRKNVARI